MAQDGPEIKKVKDYQVNGSNIFKDLWRGITGAAKREDDSYLQVHQSGKSIDRNEAISLDGDDKPEVIFKGDSRFYELRAYSKDVYAAMKTHDTAALSKKYHFSDEQVQGLFSGNKRLKQKALSENFNMEMKRVYHDYDEATQARLDDEEIYNKEKHVSTIVSFDASDEAGRLSQRLSDKAEHRYAKSSAATDSVVDYNETPEYTKDMAHKGQPGLVCRHYAAIGAMMLNNAGVEAIAFDNYMGGAGSFSNGPHYAVYLPETHDVDEFTSNPENTYQLNVFGNGINGHGLKGQIYTIDANEPGGVPSMYDPTPEAYAIENSYVRTVQTDTHTNVLASRIQSYGAEKLRDELVAGKHPSGNLIMRPEKMPDLEMQKTTIKRALEFAKEDHPEAMKILQREVKVVDRDIEEAARNAANNLNNKQQASNPTQHIHNLRS